MEELYLIGSCDEDLLNIKKTLINAKNKFGNYFFATFSLSILCVIGVVQPFFALQVISAILGIVFSFFTAFFGIISLRTIVAKRQISHPPNAYTKYCLQLHQLITIINQQIIRYNVALRSEEAINHGQEIHNDSLEKTYEALRKKQERIEAMLHYLPRIKENITDQESSKLISELSHLSLLEVDQANPLLMSPIDTESLGEEIEREQEILASFQEINQ